jgi:hypothetical protein
MRDENGENEAGDDFLRSDEYVDFRGENRRFSLELVELPTGYLLRAVEQVEGEDGYEFEAYSRSDPIEALGDLRKRIPRALSVRHLKEEDGLLTPTHDRLTGRISYGGVVIDGLFIDFSDFARMLQTYEGFQFDLRIVDPTEEL